MLQEGLKPSHSRGERALTQTSLNISHPQPFASGFLLGRFFVGSAKLGFFSLFKYLYNQTRKRAEIKLGL